MRPTVTDSPARPPESDVLVIPVDDLVPDRDGPSPLYAQVAVGIERAIHDGRLPSGARIENELALADRLALSRPTVRRAIQDLVDKGLVVRRRGIGTVVVHGPVARSIELTSLYDDLARSGRAPETRVLETGTVPAEREVADELGVALGAPVVRLRRLRLSDRVPIAVMENFLPPALAPVLDADLEREGLYRVLAARGTTMRVAKQRIGARRATAEERRLLELDRADPVLTMTRTAYDAAGAAAEFGRHAYRPDVYSFQMTLVGR